ncbi:MAG: peptidase domain-containing ABC transporter [Magnetococcales bacterium]|nr:peptidase domain-containing ABC transporter [Magnetococcales bacterium]NGZ05933.1 peptidase domain-containing ABC transporter [Magnetococcales bacterium]
MSQPPSSIATAPHSGYRCLIRLGRHHGVELPADRTPADLTGAPSLEELARLARFMGLKSKAVENKKWKDLLRLGRAYPVLARLNDGQAVILIAITPTGQESHGVVVLDPATEQNGPVVQDEAQFMASWSGGLLLLKRSYRLDDENQPFGLRWFLPEILKQKRSFIEVGLAALMMHIIAFATPLMFQIVIDKVVPHQSFQTLYVVTLVFVLAILFDAGFSFVRQNLLIYATNKIDARLVARTYAHLLSLPLQFFEVNTAGVLAKHMQQTEKVRQFLTGRLFQTLLDAAFLPLLIVILMFYSAKLMGVVLGFSLLIAVIIGLLVPLFRERLNQLYVAEGARQAHLVESVHGMRTIKSLALESTQRNAWDDKVAKTVRMHGRVSRMAASANVVTQAIEKLMQIAVISLGAFEVFSGGMSIGALVAFNMLSGRVTGPLVQIVGLINEYQEAALSIDMLGQVMNNPPERPVGVRGIRPSIKGRLEFEGVTFRYPGASMPTLDRMSFRIEAGQMIGVVGRSGSGKTTVTRLIQGIHNPQDGVIRLDGVDVRQFDLTHLRRNIGVVLQENFLFRGTIADNIAAARPEATPAEVIAAARQAGADEFIERLSNTYNTLIEENGSNLSGGQRQRLAIARALLIHPPLLIFDEATSALDPETESIIQGNLSRIARGRTMIIVSHRLSSLVDADRILVLDGGRVVDFAPHKTLLEQCESYRSLWNQQTRYMR